MDTPTLPAEDRYIQAIAADGKLVYEFDFPAYDAASVQLYVDNELWTFPADYSVQLNGLDGGNVILIREATAGQVLTIVGATPYVRTEHYVPPVADVATLNVEGDKTVYRLQQLNRDILGCLKNRRDETEVENTVLPKTVDRLGKFAVWGSGSGRLTYAGDPTEGGDDPTRDYLKTYTNLSDLTDPATARANLGIVPGHVVNALTQRPNLVFSGDSVATADVPGQLATVVTINSRIKTFADIAGILSVGQGGTGANNAIDACKNLGLAAVASTANFHDLVNIPQLVNHITNSGNGIGIWRSTINGIAAMRSLVSDGTISISLVDSGNAVELAVGAIPAERLVGVLPAASGGTGLGLNC
jgi:hypothetical protein